MFPEMDYLNARHATELAEKLIANNFVVITGNYKGITLTQPVHVLNIEQCWGILQAPEPKLCLALKEKILLYPPDLGQILSARLMSVDPILGKLELADFTLTGRRWTEHKFNKVQPRDPIYVDGKLDQTSFHARIDNISAGGMSLIILSEGRNLLRNVSVKANIRLTVALPDDEKSLNLQGQVVHSRKAGDLDILGIQLMTNRSQESRVHRYVQARRTEILAELEKTFWEKIEHHSIPGLYF